MKVTEYKGGKDDIRVLSSMVISTPVLSYVASIWKRDGLLGSPVSNTIAGLCVEYYKNHNKAPRKGLGLLLRDWAANKDTEAVGLVDAVATRILDGYDNFKSKLNKDYEISFISKYTTLIKAKKLIKDMEGAVELGRVDKIEEIHKSFSAVGVEKYTVSDVTLDRSIHTRAHAEKGKSILTYEGKLTAVGEFLGDAFAPGHLIGIAAPEKRGKTQYLLDFGWRASLQKKKVLFIEAGDMTDAQLGLRIGSYETLKPVRSKKWPLVVKYPTSFKVVGKERIIEYDDRSFTRPLNEEESWAAMVKVQEKKLMSNIPFFKMMCAPAGTLTVQDIQNTYENLAERHDWVADMIVIDYADNLTHPGSSDIRAETGKIWTGLKGTTTKYNCCIITATQTNRASYDAEWITAKHISEDKRKLAHVNGFMALNQNREEKREGVYRLSWINSRNDDFDDMSCVYVVGTLAFSKPMIIATWPEKKSEKKDPDDE